MATSGRQVSGTIQAAVTFPAKEEEGGSREEGILRSPREEGRAYRDRGPESDRDPGREIIRPYSLVSASVSAGDGFAYSPERKLLARGLGRPEHQSCLPSEKQRGQDKFKPGQAGEISSENSKFENWRVFSTPSLISSPSPTPAILTLTCLLPRVNAE